MAERVIRESYDPETGMHLVSHNNSWTGEMILHSYQDQSLVKQILSENRAIQNLRQYRKGGARLVARVPCEMDELWRIEFERGNHSFARWEDFLKVKLNSREFSYFKTIPDQV